MLKERLNKLIAKAIQALELGIASNDRSFVQNLAFLPKFPERGDFTSAIALESRSAPSASIAKAREIASFLQQQGTWINQIDVCLPGHLNFVLSDSCFQELLQSLHAHNLKFGVNAQVRLEAAVVDDPDPLKHYLSGAPSFVQTGAGTRVQSGSNPAFFVRHVYAQCGSLLRQVLEETPNLMARRNDPPQLTNERWNFLQNQFATRSSAFDLDFGGNIQLRKLLLKLDDFSEATAKATRDNEPKVVASYIYDLAFDLEEFCRASRHTLACSEECYALLGVSEAGRQIIANALALLGTNA